MPPNAVNRLAGASREDCPRPVWRPGLARRLAWRFRHHQRHLVADGVYGSWAWLTDGAEVSRYVPLVGRPRGTRLELLPEAGRHRYEIIGLVLDSEPPGQDAIALISRAFDLLSYAQGLEEAVEALVRSIHPLVTHGAGFDTSHSDPELPFSIFVSLPVGECDAAVRLAESIVHETMHLQLTLIEGMRSLVADPYATGHSPWMGTERPVRGLLHGLFVFRAIEQWLGDLANSHHDLSVARYADRRRCEIVAEIIEVDFLASSGALTPKGKRLAVDLLWPN